MSLAAESSAFFDEITKILNDRMSAREQDMESRGEGPYSSLLTQDEEPSDDYNPAQSEMAEPEVVTRTLA